MTIQLGKIGIWTSTWQWPKDPGKLQDAAGALDEAGYGTLWIGAVIGDLALPLATLDASERMVVATGIVDVWTNPAPAVAANFHTLSGKHPGRFVLGLGSSHAVLVESVTDHTYIRPLSRLRGFLDDLDAADPPVPADRRVLAALGPKALQLAAERSAGAHPYLVTPEHTATAREVMGAGPVLAPEQKVVFETDATKARDIARQSLAIYLSLPNYLNNLRRLGFQDDDFADGGSDRLVDELVAWGDLSTVKQRLDAHFDAGADHVCVQVLTDGGTTSLPLEGWQELATLLPDYS